MTSIFKSKCIANSQRRGWDKSPSLSIVFGLSSKAQGLSGLYYADFISFYNPTQLCGGGMTKSNSNELLISVPLSFFYFDLYNYLKSRRESSKIILTYAIEPCAQLRRKSLCQFSMFHQSI